MAQRAAPPWMFTLSAVEAQVALAIIATTAKASLTSNRSMSDADQPAFSIAFRIANTGAVVNRAGAWACAAWLTTRAIGGDAEPSGTLARVITRAAAPSEIDEALAAVIVPSFEKAGFSVGILATSPLPGCSSSGDRHRALAPRDIDGDDLAVERAGLLRRLALGAAISIA